MENSATNKQAWEHLRSAASVLVVSHEHPDGDTLGSAQALKSLLERHNIKATHYNTSGVPYFLEFIAPTEDVCSSLPEDISFDATVFIDNGEPLRFGADIIAMGERLGYTILFDHHVGAPDFTELAIVDSHSASTGELMLAFFEDNDLTPTPQEATALYTAIATDTGFFRFANTSPRALRSAARLMEYGAEASQINFQINERQPPAQLQMLGRVLSTLQLHADGKIALITAQKVWEKELGVGPEIYEGFVNHAHTIDGVNIAVFVREINPVSSKGSLRSRDPYDVARVANDLGGGGHRNASGCTMAMGLEDAVTAALAEAEKELKRQDS